MKLYKYGFYASLLVIAALSVWLAIVYGSKPVPKPRRQAIAMTSPDTSPFSAPVADTYTDDAGADHTVFDATMTAEVDRRTRVAAGVTAAKIEQAAEAVGAKPKEIDGVWEARAHAAEERVRFQEHTIDSMGRATRSYKGPYISITARDGAPGDSTDYGTFDYKYNLRLTTVPYSRRDRFMGLRIGARRNYIDVSSPDTNVTIDGLDYLTLEQRQPAFGLRLQVLATYGVNPADSGLWQSGRLGFGAGFRFDFGDRFNIGMNYTFSPEERSGRAAASARYDIFRFSR